MQPDVLPLRGQGNTMSAAFLLQDLFQNLFRVLVIKISVL